MSLKSLSKSMITLIVSVVLFLYIAFNYNGSLLKPIDSMTIDVMTSLPNSIAVALMTVLTNFGSFYGIVIVSTIILLGFKRKDYACYCILSSLMAYIIGYNLKEYFMRPRPDLMQLVAEGGFSFPSNHAFVATAFYGMIMLYVHYHGKKGTKTTTYLFCSLIILLVSLSRLYLRVHYLSDVVAGILLGIALISVFAIVRNLAFGAKLRSRFSAEINDMFDPETHENMN